jgi:hypothetical protein
MIYQTDEHKAHERRVAQQLAERWHCEAIEFPELSPIDWYLRRGPKLVALVEIKRKGRTFAQYPSVFLDVLKYWSLLSGAIAFGAPGLFVVDCTDGLYYAHVSACIGLRVSVVGRRDRDNPQDVRPTIAVPLKLFKPITAKESPHVSA